MTTTVLPGGLSVRTFEAPPIGWDPEKATDRERLQYGYPRCPVDFPELVQRWRRKLSDTYQFIQPEFAPRKRPSKSLQKLLGGHGLEYSGNWSGCYVVPSKDTTFKWIEATWKFPQSYLPGGARDGVEYSASTWIGIDGDNGSGDIMQAGCDSDVQTTGGSPQHQYNPWWEWYPAGSFWITNLSFRPGDEISLLICITAGSTNSAAVFFSNNTTKTGGFFHATAPAGTSILGSSAEWIVEALGTQIGFALAKFDRVDFTDCYAGTQAGTTVEAGSGQLIDMTNGAGMVTTNASVVADTEVQVMYTGP